MSVVAASSAASAAASPTKLATSGISRTSFQLNAVGSSTTFCVDNDLETGTGSVGGIFDRYNDAQAKSTGNGNVVYDTPPIGGFNLGCRTPIATYELPPDSQHAAITYSSFGNACAAPLSSVPQPWLFPSGNYEAFNCFVDDQGAGNVAFVRSSGGREWYYPANMEWWAYALDATTWTTNSANGNAPATLTPVQINAIYTCQFTDWSQVGGQPGHISVYYPQSRSPNDPFVRLYLTGIVPSQTSYCTAAGQTIHFVPENDGTQITAADLSSAILPYSFADYTAQTNGTETNLTNGQLLKKVNGVTPSTLTIKEATAFYNVGLNACWSSPAPRQFCGAHYVYHVTWDGAVAPLGGFGLPAAYYAAVIDLIGVPASGTAGPDSICAGNTIGTSEKYADTLKKYGLVPLTKATTGQSTAWPASVVPGTSFCRQF